MKITLFVFVTSIFIVLLSACTSIGGTQAAQPSTTQPSTSNATATLVAAEPVTINVFAAASLTESFGEIGQAFEAAHPGVKVVFNFAGSQQLAQQISQGAPVDVFASANLSQMLVVIQSGQVISGTQQTFVKNRLVVIFPKDNPAKLSRLQDLGNSGLKLVLADKSVPVGQYALNFLDKAVKDPAFGADFKNNVLKNVVSYEENVKSVLTKVALGEADAGIVYTTDITGDSAAQVGRLTIPDALNIIAVYPIAVIKDSQSASPAQAFMDYVLSADGQKILEKYGFIPAR